MAKDPFASTDQVQAWGRIPSVRHYLAKPRFADEVAGLIAASREAGRSTLGIGLGRSYGDSGVNAGQAVIDMTGLDRVLAFDPLTGVLRAEAGVSLDAIIRRFAPHGWFPATTPGTRFVTLGGAVANDIHGKNHHRAGAFGLSVRRAGLLRSDRGYLEISPAEDGELFRATIGGLGLTGIILWVEIQLSRITSTLVDVETIPFENCGDFLVLACESETNFEHTVGWVDCSSHGKTLGRGIFTRANWSRDAGFPEPRNAVRVDWPVDMPGFALNGLTVSSFNTLYYAVQASRPRHVTQSYMSAFYPLDAIGHWNRLYGRRGFWQYQCVTPMEAGVRPIEAILSLVAVSGEGSFLAVLKTFGDKSSPGLISFPRRGLTLALDFPNRGPDTLALLARLDEVIAEAGGRLYPAKDGRMPPALFRSGYPGLSRFSATLDPAISSSFWRRMNHD